ncbi:hypothetical protein AL542_04885 [Grimontia hollisae]|uniref:hypothetical protein n=1 Tax=Grimontia hollisae TaxID=673 RepID=UPI00058CE763|nr:hypothetical protein [Grimontia hollisae]AMG29793.1 hypothetical protein AL542_04885 [Grimontia hollisae]STO43346.1 Uncharacterised protein [Grimontia hollisae]
MNIDLREFLNILGNKINSNGLKIVMIRNYDKLPFELSGNDIDIIVNESDINIWIESLEAVCNELGLKLLIDRKLDYCYKTTIHNDNFRLELDLNFKLCWKGVKFFDTYELINNATLHEWPIWKGQEYESAYVTFHHSFLYGGFINKKYTCMYEVLLESKNIGRFRSDLNKIMPSIATFYLERKIKSGDFNLSRFTSNFIRVQVILKNKVRNLCSK